MSSEKPRRSIPKICSQMDLYSTCDEIHDKLRLLDYSESFCKQHDHPAMDRGFFAIALNNAQQFSYFSMLVSWLMKLIGHNFLEWSEFEDPTSVSTNILIELRTLGFQGQIQPPKIRPGHGEEVCQILEFLTNKALASTEWVQQAPVYKEEKENDDIVSDDGSVEEEELDMEMQEDMGDYDHLAQNMESPDLMAVDPPLSTEAVMQSKTDPKEWKAEVARLSSRLKMKYTNIGRSKEWRSHLLKANHHGKILFEMLPDAEKQLKGLRGTLNKALERIRSKERHINKDFRTHANEFDAKHTELRELTQTHDVLNKKVAELSNQINTYKRKIDAVNTKMQDRNMSMTDTSPLRKIQGTLAELRKELDSMELKIGTTRHTLSVLNGIKI